MGRERREPFVVRDSSRQRRARGDDPASGRQAVSHTATVSGSPAPKRRDAGKTPDLLISVEEGTVKQSEGAKLTVTSTAFEHQGWMPACCTCDGENVSPHLAWDGAPESTRSFVVWMEDRDVPAPSLRLFTWVHWLVYDIPAEVKALPGALPKTAVLDNGAKQGVTSFRRPGYGGPCPPLGTHSYTFIVYALDTVLGLEPARASSRSIRQAMQGHVLAEGVLVGRYNRRRRATDEE